MRLKNRIITSGKTTATTTKNNAYFKREKNIASPNTAEEKA